MKKINSILKEVLPYLLKLKRFIFTKILVNMNLINDLYDMIWTYFNTYLKKKINLSLKKDRFGYYILEITGFHGDFNLIKVIFKLLENCSIFIETGTYFGYNIQYVALNNPKIKCFSCEPNRLHFLEAFKRTRFKKNIKLFKKLSVDMLTKLTKNKRKTSQNCLFYLDAHGYGFKWQLREEINLITSYFNGGFIIIDDFKVPHIKEFGFDTYNGQECSFEYIEKKIKKNFTLYYPNYIKASSNNSPLAGWGLIVFGNVNKKVIDDNFNYLKCFK